MAFLWSKLSQGSVRRIGIRRLGRFLAILAIALAAGHLAQTVAARKAAPPLAAVNVPTKIVALSASPEATGLATKTDDPSKPLPLNHFFLTPPISQTLDVDLLHDCTPQLAASVEPGAMVALTLRAPCDRGARVVVAHGGLTVTGRVGANGRLALDIPAMDQTGRFEVRFGDGRRIEVLHPVPDLVGVKRFAVQWLGLDGFILHGFENGADFGGPGDVSPNQPGPVATGGWLVTLGEQAVDNPLMAQVYTYPGQGVADIVVEAPVTAANCGQEKLAQTLSSAAGAAEVVDLTLAMPDCSAVGDFLVLKNLASDMKVAAK